MSNRFLAHTVVASLALLVGPSLGCSPSKPDLSSPSTAPIVKSIAPLEGLAGAPMFVTIAGTGFRLGAAVTIGGWATDVTVINGSSIRATTPLHSPAGLVDVVVTNPNGQFDTLPHGFHYNNLTLTVDHNLVAPGAVLNVSWIAPGRTSRGLDGDWIGLFKVGDPNTAYLASQATTGASGTFVFNAPAEPGDYEFRYLVDDDFIDVGRSSLVTVTAASLAPR